MKLTLLILLLVGLVAISINADDSNTVSVPEPSCSLINQGKPLLQRHDEKPPGTNILVIFRYIIDYLDERGFSRNRYRFGKFSHVQVSQGVIRSTAEMTCIPGDCRYLKCDVEFLLRPEPPKILKGKLTCDDGQMIDIGP